MEKNTALQEIALAAFLSKAIAEDYYQTIAQLTGVPQAEVSERITQRAEELRQQFLKNHEGFQ